MKESQNNTESVRSFNYYGFVAYKLSDVRGSRFTETKPCDQIICSPKGRYIAVESKLMKKWKRFNATELRPNQIAHLDAVSIKRKGRAFVFVFVSIPADKKTGQKRVRKLCVLDWKKYRKKIFFGIDINDMRTQKYGVWLDPIKDKEDKIIWPIKNILSAHFGSHL